MLDGTGAYAEAAGPVVRTDRSFTVSAWANTEQATSTASTLLSCPVTTSTGSRCATSRRPAGNW